MGTLDEAIREHLELKRRLGAGDDELKKAEAEAFGPAEEDAVPGASITAPAGEGDQLDKVFSGETTAEPETTVMKPEDRPEAPEAAVVVEEGEEIEVEQTAASEAALVEVEEGEAEQEPEETVQPMTEPEVEPPAPEPPADEADASDLLEAERANLSGHPTENYDVDAAIAEEQELDILSEGRLSEELDRALDAPGADLPEGLGDVPEDEPAAEVVEEVEVTEEVDETPEPEVTPEDGQEPESASPLEETPDFLEDSPASDELWFEQGEPKDFDFGD